MAGSDMAKVILAPFISSISGKVGNLEFRTLKSGKTVVRARREDDYQSSHILSDKEKAQRRRFGLISSAVAAIQGDYKYINEAALDRKRIWQRVSYIYSMYCDTISDDAQLFCKLIDEYYRPMANRPRRHADSATESGF